MPQPPSDDQPVSRWDNERKRFVYTVRFALEADAATFVHELWKRYRVGAERRANVVEFFVEGTEAPRPQAVGIMADYFNGLIEI